MFLYFLKKLDWGVVASVIILCGIGLLSIYSTVYTPNSIYFYKQLIFVISGFFLMLVFAFLDYRIFRSHPFFLLILYVVSVLLLAAVLLFGKQVRGATSWFGLGPLNFEPVEFAKLIFILILAEYFSLRHIELYRIRHIIVSGIYMLIPVALVFFQPDLGSAMVLVFLWLGVMIIAGIKLRQLLILFLIGAIIFVIAWFAVLKTYQKERIISFINPYFDPLGSGYHRIQSVIAIGAGQVWGRGLGHGSQSQLNFLPDRYTDFIFASVAEEMGFVGMFMIIGFYFLLFFRIIKIALSATNNFARLFCVGAAIVFLFHVAVNVGMNLGILPIAGISLSFVSYGGSNLLISFITIGIVQSIAIRSK
ncbi:MAG: rod shape-determining protein RodA [Candidatus Portnoybacteria bacterium CG10_big_fil_rev_8_21_14_0_10_38_18]|uniref:Rod shape-determining protein RodA n=1 Tax=Candidatus Portnoybacteria bacterium CG10_big_fil_rev_8_21_14_0_10_38_18 TaxID=1974813 RepID=A0A2M8KCW7_9BACT|nr:MAG: rod shape-determining protein RodA [Candidatus Portnoybacteria bacterium CG10_big_fil_rev_8_21_14_0_10_38_18]